MPLAAAVPLITAALPIIAELIKLAERAWADKPSGSGPTHKKPFVVASASNVIQPLIKAGQVAFGGSEEELVPKLDEFTEVLFQHMKRNQMLAAEGETRQITLKGEIQIA